MSREREHGQPGPSRKRSAGQTGLLEHHHPGQGPERAEQDEQRVCAGLLGEPPEQRVDREQDTGEESRPGREQPPGEQDARGDRGHPGHRRQRPQRRLGVRAAEDPAPPPLDHVEEVRRRLVDPDVGEHPVEGQAGEPGREELIAVEALRAERREAQHRGEQDKPCEGEKPAPFARSRASRRLHGARV